MRTLAAAGAAGYPAAIGMLIALVALVTAIGIRLPDTRTPMKTEWFVVLAAWGALSAAAPALALRHPVRSPLLVLFGAVGFAAAFAVVVGPGDDGAAIAAALLALAVWGCLVGIALGVGERFRLQRLDG